MVLRLNTAEDFFISAKDRNRSSSLSLSLSYTVKRIIRDHPARNIYNITCLKKTLTVSVTGQKF